MVQSAAAASAAAAFFIPSRKSSNMERPIDYEPKQERPTVLGQALLYLGIFALGWMAARFYYWYNGEIEVWGLF